VSAALGRLKLKKIRQNVKVDAIKRAFIPGMS